MTRVIHTGDTHIGYQQYHSPERRADFLDAFEQVIDDAIADDVDAVVHAGDLFHDRRPGLADLHGTIEILRKLRDADIPFLAIVGNHEGTRGRQWLDLLEMLGLATRLGDDPTVVGDTAFYGLDHVPKSKRDDLDYQFTVHDQPHAALVGHGLFDPLTRGEWDAEEVLTESNLDFDAFLLGDEHKPGKQEIAETWVTYCGSTERASTAEVEDRGYNIVEFDGEVSIARRGLPVTRDFEFLSVELGETEGIERVRETIREYDLEDAVAVVEIDGDGTDVTPARVEEFALDEGALLVRVKDRREQTETDGEVEVSFADPDDAVRERVRDLGLSEAARDIDETVRESKLADANVRESVEKRVGALIDEDDVSAFESAPEDASGDTEETESAQAADSADATDSDAAVESTEPTDPTEATADGGSESPEPTSDETDTRESDTPQGEEQQTDDPKPNDKRTDDQQTNDQQIDGQSSMEEYL
ncbi:DNA double-strand break repair protein Mre11 [Halorussus halophilus]|uniref:DNA double-strand break repair protein Mre11 n=1 Tax=Halorussus halophilus TaxID=2650975 RepID=UPI0013011A15|nr:DNA double-strand break repair protein Mre11 [Halorussus halophilus]